MAPATHAEMLPPDDPGTGGRSMTACRRDRRRTWLVAAALAVPPSLLAWRHGRPRPTTPTARSISEVLPGRQPHPHRRPDPRASCTPAPGSAVRGSRRSRKTSAGSTATKWFVPGGVQILTKNDPDGRVTVLVNVTELPSVVQEVQYVGAQHMARPNCRTSPASARASR